MSFSNVQVPVDDLPQFAAVEFRDLDPRYAGVVLGVTLAIFLPILLFAAWLNFFIIVPNTDLSALGALLYVSIAAVAVAYLAWFAHKSASVIRYAVREHDVIVQSGVFWRKETVQPIVRIQHVEQHQGPVDKRLGLYELKLFSAGTGHFTFKIPGLDRQAADGIRRFILDAQQDGWVDDPDRRQSIDDDEDTDRLEVLKDASGELVD